MTKVGITGGIGSGKTLICHFLKYMGVPVFNADLIGKQLMNTKIIQEQILSYFGETIIKNNEIDRKQLAYIVFSNKDKLEKLNSLIHPAVYAEFENWQKLQGNQPIVFIESAILIQSNGMKFIDKLVVVTAPINERIARIMLRDNATRQDVENRMKNQQSEEEMLKHADFYIVNSNNSILIPEVLNMLQYFQ